MTSPKLPKPTPAVPPVSMRQSDVIDTERNTMLNEKRRKGIGATILAGANVNGPVANQPTLGRRTLLAGASY